MTSAVAGKGSPASTTSGGLVGPRPTGGGSPTLGLTPWASSGGSRGVELATSVLGSAAGVRAGGTDRSRPVVGVEALCAVWTATRSVVLPRPCGSSDTTRGLGACLRGVCGARGWSEVVEALGTVKCWRLNGVWRSSRGADGDVLPKDKPESRDSSDSRRLGLPWGALTDAAGAGGEGCSGSLAAAAGGSVIFARAPGSRRSRNHPGGGSGGARSSGMNRAVDVSDIGGMASRRSPSASPPN